MGNDDLAKTAGRQVLVRFQASTAFQHPQTGEMVKRLKGDQDVLPKGFAMEMESCDLVKVLGNVADIPTIQSIIEDEDDGTAYNS